MLTILCLSNEGQTPRREQLRVPRRKSLATKFMVMTDDNRSHNPKISYRCPVKGHLKLEVAAGREEQNSDALCLA